MFVFQSYIRQLYILDTVLALFITPGTNVSASITFNCYMLLGINNIVCLFRWIHRGNTSSQLSYWLDTFLIIIIYSKPKTN